VRIPTKNPPSPVGEVTLIVYDTAAWEKAREYAAEWQTDLGLYVEYALRHYAKGRHSKLRLARWKHERDMQDPDMKLIYETVHEGEPEPEYMDPKYLSKRKREALALEAEVKPKPKRRSR